MLIAVLSDIHGNREAFAAVLEDCAERGAERIALLGDIVGYGPDPEWCTDKARDLADGGAILVKGNHDSAIDTPGESMNPVARAAIDWTRPRLSARQRGFLAGLPLTATLGETLFTHASAHSPGDWIYITGERQAMASFRTSEARAIFCGHVHVPALYSCDLAQRVRGHEPAMAAKLPLITSRRWLVVAGSVGQPRDGVPRAGYVLYDTDRKEISFRRVAYDVAATVQKLRAANLPEALAARLLAGK